MATGKEFKRKKVVYIAGRYRDERGEYWVRQHIRKAEEAAIQVWFMGGVALCPHKNTAGLGGAALMDDSVWLKGDLELLSRCDAIYTVNNWQLSSGAKAEVWFARQNGIPILLDRQDLKEFLRDEDADVPNL